MHIDPAGFIKSRFASDDVCFLPHIVNAFEAGPVGEEHLLDMEKDHSTTGWNIICKHCEESDRTLFFLDFSTFLLADVSQIIKFTVMWPLSGIKAFRQIH